MKNILTISLNPVTKMGQGQSSQVFKAELEDHFTHATFDICLLLFFQAAESLTRHSDHVFVWFHSEVAADPAKQIRSHEECCVRVLLLKTHQAEHSQITDSVYLAGFVVSE